MTAALEISPETPDMVIGLDIGGTKVIGLLVTAVGAVRHRVYRPHRAWGPTEVTEILAEIVAECLAANPASRVVAAGLSLAGWLSPDRTAVVRAANLGLDDDPLPPRLAEWIGLPVVMENDGNAAALAEHRFGAAQACLVSATLTVGTGVGGGIVVDGRVLAGGRGLAGELGHLPLDPTGPPCACGGRGCLEAYASGPAIAAGAGAATAEQPVTAARSGDAAAMASLAAAGAALGEAIARVCAVVDPSTVLIGGGVAAGAGELLLDPVRERVRAELPLRDVTTAPRIDPAACGPDAGALGAAALAQTLITRRRS